MRSHTSGTQAVQSSDAWAKWRQTIFGSSELRPNPRAASASENGPSEKDNAVAERAGGRQLPLATEHDQTNVLVHHARYPDK
eukprot:6232094-Pyramimonas_sp.AAC.1